jgi:exonuclease III
LVKAGLDISQPRICHQDTDGRLLLVTFQSGPTSHPWAVLAAYGPVEPGHRNAFFQGPFAQACDARPRGSTLLVGDFNCVSSVLDLHTAHPNPHQTGRLVGGGTLQAVQTEHGLSDVWRVLHPNDREYTRTTHSALQVVTSGGPPGGYSPKSSSTLSGVSHAHICMAKSRVTMPQLPCMSPLPMNH